MNMTIIKTATLRNSFRLVVILYGLAPTSQLFHLGEEGRIDRAYPTYRKPSAMAVRHTCHAGGAAAVIPTPNARITISNIVDFSTSKTGRNDCN